MSTVTIDRSVTIQDTSEALQQQLGARYEVTTHGHGAQEALKVKQSAASLATVTSTRVTTPPLSTSTVAD